MLRAAELHERGLLSAEEFAIIKKNFFKNIDNSDEESCETSDVEDNFENIDNSDEESCETNNVEENPKKYCRNCGFEISQDANFCTSCGARLN